MMIKLRRTLASGVLAFSFLSGVQASTGEMNFETSGERVALVLADWTKRFNEPLLATKSVADDVVVLRFQNVSKKDALDRLASLLHASWRPEHGRLYLSRTDAQERQEISAERTARIESIKAAQAEIASDLASQGTFDATAAKSLTDAVSTLQNNRPGSPMEALKASSRNDSRTPVGRGTARMRLLLSPEELADLPIGIQVVYSNSPTKLERPLPAEATKILQQIYDEQAILGGSTAETPDQQRTGPSFVFTNQSGTFRRPSFTTNRPGGDMAAFPEVPTRALLLVSRLTHDSNLQFTLALATASGKLVARSNSSFTFSAPAGTFVSKGASPTPLQLPADAVSFMSLMRQRSSPDSTLMPLQRQELLHPDEFEPLSLCVGRALLAVAKAQNENLAALLSDRFIGALYQMTASESMTIDQVLNPISAFGRIEEGNGWLIVRPLTPAFNRSINVKRDKLAAYLGKATSEKGMTMEQLANWSMQLPDTRDNSLPRRYELLLRGTQTGPIQDENVLRLYGGMTAEQRTAATSGAGLPVSTLSEVSAEAFNRLIFGFGAGLSFDLVQTPDHPIDFDWINGLGREPSEALANGLLANGRLKISESSGPIVMSPTQAAGQYFNAQQLAAALARPFNTRVRNFGVPAPLPTKFYLGKARSLEFRFDFGPSVHWGPSTLIEAKVGGTDPVDYAGLPADFRADVDKRVEEMKQRFSRSGTGTFSGPGSPPPH
jgi:hypothetical protein